MEKNNSQKEKVKKLKKLMSDVNVGMLATDLDKTPFSVCPMAIQDIDEKGDLWFLTNKTSDHFNDIENDSRVQLVFANENIQKYISIYGAANHTINEKKIDDLWNPLLDTWFDDKDDPNLAVLRISIINVYYWNNKENKLVPLFQKNQNLATKTT